MRIRPGVLMMKTPPGVRRSGAGVLGLLLASLGLLALHAHAACPSACTCSPGHREADCSWRGLRQLPDGLQHNLRSLNLSHNRLHGLDRQLTPYAHLRTLDVSHNRLTRLPAALPRALWELRAAANRIRLLDKNDTAYQWNLRLLDLSDNKLERAVFINNTLPGLRLLNLSRNQFWTVPTNMPAGVETVDLSHNSLVQVLPGSLDRLPRLARLYLHANRFAALGPGAFGRLSGLRLVTLGDNPWDCGGGDAEPLLAWLRRTPARVLGCPCHAQPVCGEARPARTGGWHFASYTLPPLAAGTPDSGAPQAGTGGWWYLSEGAQNTRRATPLAFYATDAPETTAIASATNARVFVTGRLTTDKPTTDRADASLATDRSFSSRTTAAPPTATGGLPAAATKRTTTLRTRSVRRPNQTLPGDGGGGVRNSGPAFSASAAAPVHLMLNLGMLTLSLTQDL